MPEKKTIEQAREGKAPTTQAGAFVEEEIRHVREGKHGARSAKQAIAIGLSKVRRAGVKLRPPKKGTTSEETREKAERDSKEAGAGKRPSARRSAATMNALKKEGHQAATSSALSRQASEAARKRRRRSSATQAA